MTNVVITDPEFIAAQTRLLDAQTEGQNWDNVLAKSLADSALLALNRERRKSDWEDASPSNHRKFIFTGAIDMNTTSTLIDTLSRWERIDEKLEDASISTTVYAHDANALLVEDDKPKKRTKKVASEIEAPVLGRRPYTIQLCSPGGDVIAGFQAFSYLQGLAKRRKLTISAAGVCASMATVLHQAASPGERVIEPGCSYLIHEVTGSVGGRLDNILDTTEWVKRLNLQLQKVLADRSGHTTDEIVEKMHRREHWLMAEEALAYGLADRLGYV